MLKLLTPVVVALLIAAAAAPARSDEATDIPADHVPIGPELLDALAEGGQVIFFRHAATDHDMVDTDRVNLENCATQRNLSELGRRQATAIGEAFAALGIPVGEVLSSPYCRCIDTVRLAFGRATVTTELVFALDTGAARTAELAEALRTMLATVPAAGTNTVISGHTVNMIEATGLWPKPEGAAMIFRPDGAGGFEHLGNVMPGEWTAFAARE